MPKVKEFSDGSLLEFGHGSFDGWCIYLTRPSVARHAPRDTDYFQRLKDLSAAHTPSKIYNDYVEIYESTGKDISDKVLVRISCLAATYADDETEMDILFTILYQGMIAEENKKYTKLGKRIKRLGMYQLLNENLPAAVAANYSRGMEWEQIDAACTERGF